MEDRGSKQYKQAGSHLAHIRAEVMSGSRRQGDLQASGMERFDIPGVCS